LLDQTGDSAEDKLEAERDLVDPEDDTQKQ
jgi:hypothetical protein